MTDERSIGAIVVDWYRSSLDRDDGAARAARAQLRRCVSPAEALIVAETHDLDQMMKAHGRTLRPDRLALLATTFCHLQGIRGDRLAILFGRRPGKDGPRALSELRFQSLIRARSSRDLIVPLRRSLAVLGSDPACNGHALAEDLFWWGENVRNNWCFEYFGAEFPRTIQEEKTQ